LLVKLAVEHQRQLQHALVAAAEERQRAMRGDREDRFRVGEIVLELGGFVFLAGNDRRLHEAVRFEMAAQLAEQRGVFRELFHEDLAGAVEDASDVGKTGFGVEVARGFGFGRQRRVGQQASASGARPASRAICALLRRFGLYGR
jgi:hypothetical protein